MPAPLLITIRSTEYTNSVLRRVYFSRSPNKCFIEPSMHSAPRLPEFHRVLIGHAGEWFLLLTAEALIVIMTNHPLNTPP